MPASKWPACIRELRGLGSASLPSMCTLMGRIGSGDLSQECLEICIGASTVVPRTRTAPLALLLENVCGVHSLVLPLGMLPEPGVRGLNG